MLWRAAMSLHRVSWSTLALLGLLGIACDPMDQGPPAATADNQLVPPPPPPLPPGAAGAEATGATDPGTMYASGEYALGEDADAYDDNDPAALTDFHAALDAHGAWVDDPTYGTVWSPAPGEVGPDFTPYSSAGHWVYDSDYVWVSDYDWGWAPFHYGRWVFIDGRGWAWVPGREYRGAWVGWGVDDGYGFVGWYPLAPAYLWFGGVGVTYGFPIGPRWSYCRHGDVFSPALGAHVVHGAAAASLAGRVHAIPTVADSAPHGPEPARLGFRPAQIPHASGAGAAALARAQQFSRPSTAAVLGARPPTRASTAATFGAGARPSLTGGGGAAATPGPRAGTPGVGPPSQAPARRPETQSAPIPHASHEMRMGGGHHR
jgi:hypothetical protein